MKNPFKKTTKKAEAKVKTINKEELKNIVGGTGDAVGVKIAADKTGTFWHS